MKMKVNLKSLVIIAVVIGIVLFVMTLPVKKEVNYSKHASDKFDSVMVEQLKDTP